MQSARGRPDIAVVFVILGIYQLLRGQIFSAASSLFFYALALPHIAAMEQARGDSLGSVAARTAKDASSDSEEEDFGPGCRSLSRQGGREVSCCAYEMTGPKLGIGVADCLWPVLFYAETTWTSCHIHLRRLESRNG